MPEFNYSRAVIAPFAPGMLDDAPVDYVKRMVLNRAGVPKDHALRSGVGNTHAADKGGVRTPTPFPPDGVHCKTVGEYFAALDKLKADAAPAPAPTIAPQAAAQPIAIAPVESAEAPPAEA